MVDSSPSWDSFFFFPVLCIYVQCLNIDQVRLWAISIPCFYQIDRVINSLYCQHKSFEAWYDRTVSSGIRQLPYMYIAPADSFVIEIYCECAFSLITKLANLWHHPKWWLNVDCTEYRTWLYQTFSVCMEVFPPHEN